MSLELLCQIYPGRNRREPSQWSFLVKASWHAPLICPLTEEKEKENWTQLRTETLFKEQLNWKRVLALDTQIFDSLHATVSASNFSISSNLSLRLKESGGAVSFLDGGCVTLMPAGDGWGRKNSRFIVKAILLCCLWAILICRSFHGLKTALEWSNEFVCPVNL